MAMLVATWLLIMVFGVVLGGGRVIRGGVMGVGRAGLLKPMAIRITQSLFLPCLALLWPLLLPLPFIK